MAILITGAGGFIGSNILSSFKRYSKLEVYGCVRRPSGSKNLVVCNLESYAEIVSAVQKYGIKIVIHCAANISDFYCPIQNEKNIKMAYNIQSCLDKSKIDMIINISSIPLIGPIKYSPIDESHPISPQTPYHKAKWEIEKIFSLSEYSNKRVYNIRIASPLGPGMRSDKFFSVILNKALKNEVIEIFGNKKFRQNFIDIRDLYQLFHTIVKSRPISGTYLFGHQRAMTYTEAASIMIKHIDSKSILRDLTSEGDCACVEWDINTERVRKNIGVVPLFGLAETINWVLANDENNYFF